MINSLKIFNVKIGRIKRKNGKSTNHDETFSHTLLVTDVINRKIISNYRENMKSMMQKL